MSNAAPNPFDASRNNSVCAACGSEFRCGAVGQDAQCWCFELPHIAADAKEDPSCLCPGCLAGFISKSTTEG